MFLFKSSARVAVALFVTAWLSGCGTPFGPGQSGFHPDNYARPDKHGTDLKMQAMDCRECHGANLDGGEQVGCDGCHAENWRTTCTFCHGASENATGAPPRDINGTTDPNAISFPPHTTHVMATIAKPFDCVQCHTKPTDVLSVNHIFETNPTPGKAEVSFNGLSNGASYDGQSCSQVYCHSNGQSLSGHISKTDGPRTCTSCHAGINSSNSAFGGMSGRHQRHMGEGLGCNECHSTVADSSNLGIVDTSLHVNGNVDVSITASGFTISGTNSCSGYCHGKLHFSESW